MATSLKQVRAAQLRTRATRGAIGRIALGSVFLVGALSHTLAPDHGEGAGVTWATLLLVMSSVYVGLGLRVLARLRRKPPALWLAGTLGWAVLSVALATLLMRR